MFHCRIENTTDNTTVKEQPGGIGLVNVKRRLELLYPGRYELCIDKTSDRYIVQLNLQPHEN
jgi:sensor histidine kinase YesM